MHFDKTDFYAVLASLIVSGVSYVVWRRLLCRKSDIIFYETKCRRCGKLTEWFLAVKGSMSKITFISYIGEKSGFASTYKCSRCKKSTIQDLIGHTEFSELD